MGWDHLVYGAANTHVQLGPQPKLTLIRLLRANLCKIASAIGYVRTFV